MQKRSDMRLFVTRQDYKLWGHSYLPAPPTFPFTTSFLPVKSNFSLPPAPAIQWGEGGHWHLNSDIYPIVSECFIVSTGMKISCTIIIESASSQWHRFMHKEEVWCSACLFTLSLCVVAFQKWKKVYCMIMILLAVCLCSRQRPIEASHYNQRPSSPLIRPLTNKLWLTPPPSDYCNHQS